MNQAVAGGAFVSVNHPKPYGPPWAYPRVTGYHVVEVWNGPWEGRNAMALAHWEECPCQGKRLVALGGSDTHVLCGQRRDDTAPQLGQPTTWIGLQPGETPTVSSVLTALRAGRSFITASPQRPERYVSRVSDELAIRVVGGEGAALMVLDQSGAVDSGAVRGHDIALNIPCAAGSAFPRAQLADASGRMLALSNPSWRGREWYEFRLTSRPITPRQQPVLSRLRHLARCLELRATRTTLLV